MSNTNSRELKTFNLNLGLQHPSAHGRLILGLNGALVCRVNICTKLLCKKPENLVVYKTFNRVLTYFAGLIRLNSNKMTVILIASKTPRGQPWDNTWESSTWEKKARNSDNANAVSNKKLPKNLSEWQDYYGQAFWDQTFGRVKTVYQRVRDFLVDDFTEFSNWFKREQLLKEQRELQQREFWAKLTKNDRLIDEAIINKLKNVRDASGRSGWEIINDLCHSNMSDFRVIKEKITENGIETFVVKNHFTRELIAQYVSCSDWGPTFCYRNGLKDVRYFWDNGILMKMQENFTSSCIPAMGFEPNNTINTYLLVMFFVCAIFVILYMVELLIVPKVINWTKKKNSKSRTF